VEELAARRVEPLVGVRAEVIPLGLEQVGRQLLKANAGMVLSKACSLGSFFTAFLNGEGDRRARFR
jgi:hypothetical protein